MNSFLLSLLVFIANKETYFLQFFTINTTFCFSLYLREGHVSVARLLLEAGADVETPDNYGQSPFFMACWKGHAVVAALLLEYDANKDCRTKTGITPLFQVKTTWFYMVLNL